MPSTASSTATNAAAQPPDFRVVAARTWRTAFIALLVAIVIAAIAMVNIFTMRSNARWVDHTHEVLRALANVVGDVHEAEIDTQAYLITGDNVFLAAYQTIASRIEPEMRNLQALTVDNPSQSQRLVVMHSLVSRKLALLHQELEAERQFGSDSSIAAARISEAHTLMAQLQSISQTAINEERILLAKRADAQDRNLWMTVLAVAIGVLCGVYLVATSHTRLLRVLRARERAEEAAIDAREHAESANRAKSDFLARMSHELRTPLNSVIGFANVMRRNKDGHLTASDMTYLERIQANGHHLLSLINQILDLSKIEAGRVELFVEPVDIGVIARDVVSQFEPQARECGIEVRAEVPGPLMPFETDGEKLRQILINLVGNAMKFTEQGSVNVIVRERRGAVVAIDVRDTGIGIPADRLGAVFDAFEQAETSTTRKYGGTGLGLSISRSLAQLLNLELKVDSVLGEGTTFTIVFPSHSGEITPVRGMKTEEWSKSQAIDLDALHDRLVLIIDDDADSRTLLAQYLEDMGCRVIAATNGEQGLRVANRFSPDALILDIRMPGLDGWEVMRRLNADPALQHTPTVVVSIVATEHAGRAPDGLVLLDKPCTREQLGAALSQVLRGAMS